MERQLEGTVEADDLYHTAGNKGQAQGGGKKSLGRRARGRRKKREPGRGHYDKDHIPANYVVEGIPAQRKPPEVRICRVRNQGRGARPPSNVSEQLTRNGRAFLSLPSQNLRHSRLRWA
jgi:hypothetical protein